MNNAQLVVKAEASINMFVTIRRVYTANDSYAQAIKNDRRRNIDYNTHSLVCHRKMNFTMKNIVKPSGS